MKSSLFPSPRFEKGFLSLSKEERAQTAAKLEILAENPRHPSLRTKRVAGTKGLFESSVNMDIRILWKYGGDVIILAAAGHHDILKKF